MVSRDDIAHLNSEGWDRRVAEGDRWTQPVSSEDVARARKGDWSVVLTPSKPVPRHWFGELAGAKLLCLASGGGQQGPILAAAGADVIVYDASAAQLAQDAMVAARDGLDLVTRQGLMQDLSALADASFDLVFHPVSNCFTPDVAPVWREAFRVLKPGGALLAGFMNPIVWLFDEAAQERGELVVRYSIPFADIDQRASDVEALIARDHTLEFGHTLEDQIGGQLKAGFALTDLFEDRYADADHLMSRHFPISIATRAVKPAP
jgi:SAM-dependent methyltransferase